MNYIAGTYWGKVPRGWGYEVRVDYTEATTGKIKNEVLLFLTDPKNSEITTIINERKVRLDAEVIEEKVETIIVSQGTKTLIEDKDKLREKSLKYIVTNPKAVYSDYKTWCEFLTWESSLLAQRIVYDYYQNLWERKLTDIVAKTEAEMYVVNRDFTLSMTVEELKKEMG